MNVALSVDDGYPLSTQQASAFHWLEILGRVPRVTVTIDNLQNISIAAVRQALDRVSARHEVLRTLYQAVPGLSLPLQVVLPSPQYSVSGREGDEPAIDPFTGPLFHADVTTSPSGKTQVRISCE